MNAKVIHFIMVFASCLLIKSQLEGQNCLNLQTFDSYPLGVALPAPMNPGYFSAYGSPIVIDQNCPLETTGLGVQIKGSVDGSAGDAVGYTMTGGIGGGEQFLAGQQYVFRGSKLLINGDLVNTYQNAMLHIRLTNDLSIGNNCPAGICEQIVSKSISELVSATCEDWGDMLFTPSSNYDHFIISVTASNGNGQDELFIMIDNWCVEKVDSPGCEASFTWFESECGEICFSSTSEGANSYLYTFTGPGPVQDSNVDNFCRQIQVPGIYRAQLTIECANGTFVTSPEQEFTVSPITTPFYACPIDPVVIIGTRAECTVEHVVSITPFDSGNAIINEICTLDGTPFTNKTLTLPEGQFTINCTATNSCGNTGFCEYTVIVECEEEDDTNCVDFDDGSNNGWYVHNYFPAYSRIYTRPVALQASGPSGLPSDVYMEASDVPGSTTLVNETTLTGDWREYIGECFCFDYNVIDDGDSGGIPLDAAPGFVLASAFDNTQPIMWGINPVSAISWKSSISKTERDGWNNFCIGIDSCDASGNLPSVPNGTWSYITGASSTCQDFNNILANVETVMFGLDLTGSPTEVYGFDNFCTGPCPPDPSDCTYSLTVDTLMSPDGQCCYELDFDAPESWSYVTFNLETPGVIFNTAMVDTSTFRVDTLSNGTQLRVASKSPQWGGHPAGNYLNFMEFCFANVDSASQSPQCVVAEYFKPGPVDGPVLACRDTLKFNCPAPTEIIDTCLTITDMNAECDEEDPHKYTLTYTASNNSNFTASQVNLTSLDPNIKFLPLGAPAGATPQSTISIGVAGGLLPGASTTLMVNVILTSAVSAPQSWCVSGHLYSQSMCCTSPTDFCTELDLCCDSCEEKGFDISDISGIPVPQLFNYGANDDGDVSFVQAGGGPDVSGPTLTVRTFDNSMVSDGETNRSYINFDFLQDICEGAVVSSARLRLYADTNTAGHSASAVDNSCIAIQRIANPWNEFTLVSTLPSVSTTTTTFMNSPTFQYMNYDVDVTALVNDMINSGGFGFAISAQCSDKSITLNFASKDHPNTALHPQLVLTIDDQNCPEPSLDGTCCHAVDLINECPTDFFTHVELKSITPGVNIGSHATGGTAPQDWYVSNSTPNCVTWNHTSGYIPYGTTTDLIQFCLDDIDATEVPQDVVLHWYALGGNGEPYIACSDTIRFECETNDNGCIAVIDTELKGSPCDSLDCYETPWCLVAV